MINFKKLVTGLAEDLDEQETPSERAIKGLTFDWNDPVSGQTVNIDPVQKQTGAMAAPSFTPTDPEKYVVEGGNTSTLAPPVMPPGGFSSSNDQAPPPPSPGGTEIAQPEMMKPDMRSLVTDPFTAKQNRLDYLSNAPIKPEKKWEDILAYIVQGVNAAFNPHPDNRIVGYGRIKRDNEIRQVSSDLARMEGMRDRQLARNLKQAQIANIYTDNDRQERERLDQAAKAVTDARDRKRGNWFKARKFFDPSKATDADRRQLAEFDETPESIGMYDFTRPNLKTVAGVTFKLNPNTGAFEDSGLPKDPSKAIVEYEVVDRATGARTKYAVSSEKAASLKTQLEAAGMQIEAAKERQASSQRHAVRMAQIDRDTRMALEQYRQAQQNGRAAEANALKQKMIDLRAEKQRLEAEQDELDDF